MKKELTFLSGMVASLAMVSCYPPPEPRMPTPEVPVAMEDEETMNEGLNGEDYKEFKRWQLENQRNSDFDDRGSPVTEKPVTGGGDGLSIDADLERESPENPVIKKPINKPNGRFVYARKVPNKPGFVFNPYNQKKVDVRGLASGTLVSDPRDPNQKFYVP